RCRHPFRKDEYPYPRVEKPLKNPPSMHKKRFCVQGKALFCRKSLRVLIISLIFAAKSELIINF
ncbi:MAG: hypothetical protein RR280_09275, partial [Bacteroidaceae bacterium]